MERKVSPLFVYTNNTKPHEDIFNRNPVVNPFELRFRTSSRPGQELVIEEYQIIVPSQPTQQFEETLLYPLPYIENDQLPQLDVVAQTRIPECIINQNGLVMTFDTQNYVTINNWGILINDIPISPQDTSFTSEKNSTRISYRQVMQDNFLRPQIHYTGNLPHFLGVNDDRLPYELQESCISVSLDFKLLGFESIDHALRVKIFDLINSSSSERVLNIPNNRYPRSFNKDHFNFERAVREEIVTSTIHIQDTKPPPYQIA